MAINIRFLVTMLMQEKNTIRYWSLLKRKDMVSGEKIMFLAGFVRIIDLS